MTLETCATKKLRALVFPDVNSERICSLDIFGTKVSLNIFSQIQSTFNLEAYLHVGHVGHIFVGHLFKYNLHVGHVGRTSL